MVIAVLALFAWTVCAPWRPPGYSFKANAALAGMDLQTISQALANYAADHDGEYPADLIALIEHGDGKPAYLPSYWQVPNDPWRRQYLYELRAGGGWRVWTLGSDGIAGGSGEARDQSVESK